VSKTSVEGPPIAGMRVSAGMFWPNFYKNSKNNIEEPLLSLPYLKNAELLKI
jgi:hypothetical protein